MTRHAQFLLQPEKFRTAEEVPEWVHFPRLHLLLGWGPGLWETLGCTVFGLRYVFKGFPIAARPDQPPVESLIIRRADYFQLSTTIREHAPSLTVECVGPSGFARYEFLPDGRPASRAVSCDHAKSHVIVPDGEYRVRHTNHGDGPAFVLARRTKTLKQEYRSRLLKTLVDHAPQGFDCGSRGDKGDAAHDQHRKAAEQKFAVFVAKKKADYVECRAKQMFSDRKVRPADFEERKAAHVRSRLGAMERGKRDSRGMPKRPYGEEQLLRLTCGEVARLEATDLLFDYGEEELFVLDTRGTWSPYART